MMGRRRFLAVAAAVAVPVVGFAGLMSAPVHKRFIRTLLRWHFGSAIAESEAAREFSIEYSSTFAERWRSDQVIENFVQRTTVIRALESGEELAFLGLEGPKDLPCANPLSSHWL